MATRLKRVPTMCKFKHVRFVRFSGEWKLRHNPCCAWKIGQQNKRQEL